MAGRARRLIGAAPAYAHLVYEALAPRALGGAGRPRIVQAVVRGPHGVLLCTRRELLGWELPGGAVQRGECDEEALLREVREETGLDVAIERPVGVYERSGFRSHEAHVFVCRPTGGAPRPSRETPEVAWFDERRLPAAIFPWFRVALDDALAERQLVHRRERQGLAAILAGARIDLRSRWRGLD